MRAHKHFCGRNRNGDPTPIADTYVSAMYPDTAFGTGHELRLNGGKNEKIIFATYSSKLLEDDGSVVLTVPALNDACVNVELFLIDGYCVNENKLNYNNMPKLDGSDIELADKTTASAVSLGKYVIKGGENSIVLDAEKIGNVERECFTIAIKATNDEKDVYVFDFIPELEFDLSSPEVNKDSIFDTHVVSYEGEDEEIHAYTHNSDGKFAFLGNFTDLQTRNDDAYGELYYFSVTSMGAYGVYNALSDEAITKDANGDVWTRGVKITGKTYRFSAIVRSNSGTKYYAVGAGPAVADGQYKGYDEENGIPDPLNNFYVKSDFIGTDIRNWVRPTVDYTVNPDHIADDTYGNYVTYPAFIIRGASRTDGKVAATGQVADLHTVELTADGKEREVVLNSIEGSETDTIKIEISDAKYATFNDVADAKAINVFEFKAPKLSAVSNAEGKVDLVTLKKGIDMPILSADPDTGALIVGNAGDYYQLCDEEGNLLKLSETATTSVTVVYNGIKGEARYFVNKNIAYVLMQDEVVPAVDILVYDSNFTSDAADKIGFKFFLGLYADNSFITAEDYALTATKINNDDAKIIAYQESTVSNGIRIIAGLDSLYYTSVGFDVEIYEGGELVKSESVSNNVVYSSIIADGEIEITAKEKGYNYLATLNIVNLPEDIPENSYIKICSFTEIAGIKHRDKVATINVTNDGYAFDVLDDTEIFTKKQAVLLMGQSNMAGRGVASTVDPISDDRIKMLRDGEFIKMAEPIHQDKTAAGVGLAASFAKAFVETFDQELALIPCAYGGTGIDQWSPSSSDRFNNAYGTNKNYQLYQNAVDSAKKAMDEGYEICAILWHQGENGQNDAQYDVKLKAIFDSLLADIGLDPNDVVIITGELGPWKNNPMVNQLIPNLANYYPNYGVAQSYGLPNNPNDSAHFLAPCYRVFGYRYFDQFYKIVTGKNYTNFVDDYTYYELKNDEDDNDDEVVDTTSYVANVTFNDYNSGTTYSATTTVGNVKFTTSSNLYYVIFCFNTLPYKEKKI